MAKKTFKWSGNKEISSRYKDLEKKIKKELKKLPKDMTEIYDAPEVEIFTLKMIQFLEELKRNHLDVDMALKIVGVSREAFRLWMRKPHFVATIEKINACYADAVLADGKTMAGWSIEILRDIHNSYKAGDSKSASALATMAGHMLKATGNFTAAESNNTPQVLIQINTGGGPVEKSKKSIDLVGETSIGAIESVSSGTEIKLNFGKNESKSKESPSYLHLLR
jgi:hypothetical protein